MDTSSLEKFIENALSSVLHKRKLEYMHIARSKSVYYNVLQFGD